MSFGFFLCWVTLIKQSFLKKSKYFFISCILYFFCYGHIMANSKIKSTAKGGNINHTVPEGGMVKCQSDRINQKCLILKATDRETVRSVVAAHAGTATAEVQETGVRTTNRT